MIEKFLGWTFQHFDKTICTYNVISCLLRILTHDFILLFFFSRVVSSDRSTSSFQNCGTPQILKKNTSSNIFQLYLPQIQIYVTSSNFFFNHKIQVAKMGMIWGFPPGPLAACERMNWFTTYQAAITMGPRGKNPQKQPIHVALFDSLKMGYSKFLGNLMILWFI